MKLKDKVAIVTGAGQGIGQGTAVRFAGEGAKVVVADLDLKTAEQTAADICSKGGDAIAVKVDVSVRKEVEKLASAATDKYKRVDILVNNAGIALIKPITVMTEEEWDRVVSINLTGTFLCCQAAAKEMIKQKYGKIVNLASVAGHRGSTGSFAYTTTKMGVRGMTRALAVELADYNITVNSVSPGITETPMVKVVADQGADVLAARARRVPLNRIGKIEDVVNMITFFASGESDYITGQDVAVDGGTLAIHSGFVRI